MPNIDRPLQIWNPNCQDALTQLTAKRYLAMRENHALSEQAISVQLAEAQVQGRKSGQRSKR